MPTRPSVSNERQTVTKRILVCSGFFCLSFLAIVGFGLLQRIQAAENILPDRQVSSAATRIQPKLVASYGKLAPSFEANRGQTDARVRSLTRGGGYTIFLAANPLQGSLGGGQDDTFVAMISPGGAGPSVSPSELSLEFGPQDVGTTSAAKTVTVTNPGTVNLTIMAVTIGGTNARDFAKSADTCAGATVIPSGTCAVSVTFTPSAMGSRSASLKFTTNAIGGEQTWTLSGTGLAPLVSLSAPDLSFGNQTVSTTSAAQAEIVTNSGTANLTISTVTMRGENASDFAKSADTCTGATVIPNGTCTVSVTFTPSATGSRSASLSFNDNTSDSPQTVTLSGTGGAPAVSLSDSSLSFANQLVGTASAGQGLTVTNSGTANLAITSVGLTGSNASDFAKSADTCTGATVIPNGTCTVSVTFTPSATGSRSASLSFNDNASGSPQRVTLSGTGGAPAVSLSDSSLTFTNQLVGTASAGQGLTVTNSGTANLAITSVGLTGSNASDFAKSADTCAGATLTPNGTCTLSVTFTPSATGSRTATLSINDNAANSPQTVSLSGTGT